MAVEKYKLGSTYQPLTTELNALANNALNISAAFNNVQGGGAGDGYLSAIAELVVTFGTAPTANTAVAVWFLVATDGTNYEDGGTSVTPARAPDVVFPVRAVTTAQRIARPCAIPPSLFKVLLRNDGTGQAFAATGNVLSLRPVASETV